MRVSRFTHRRLTMPPIACLPIGAHPFRARAGAAADISPVRRHAASVGWRSSVPRVPPVRQRCAPGPTTRCLTSSTPYGPANPQNPVEARLPGFVPYANASTLLKSNRDCMSERHASLPSGGLDYLESVSSFSPWSSRGCGDGDDGERGPRSPGTQRGPERGCHHRPEDAFRQDHRQCS